jgi:glycosyltransferase involved in cell wall biosynthesis
MINNNNSLKILPSDITAIILTYNEEKHIERCINSIKYTAKRIVIIDSYSNDNTLNILKKHNVEVLQNKFINQSKQLNWGIENAKIKTNWVLRLDSDEILTHSLIKKISENLTNYASKISGITVNRELIFFGKNINFGGVFPHKTLRIWKNGKGKCDDLWVDEHVMVDGEVTHINEPIIDENLNNLNWWVKKHKSYAIREAISFLLYKVNLTNYISNLDKGGQFKKKKKYTIYYKLPIILRPLILFMYSFFFRLGFLNGWQGLVFHFLQGFWFRFLVDFTILELKIKMKKDNLTLVQVVKSKYGYLI